MVIILMMIVALNGDNGGGDGDEDGDEDGDGSGSGGCVLSDMSCGGHFKIIPF